MDMPKTARKLVKSPSRETEKAQTREVGEGKKESSMPGEKLRKVSRMGFLGFLVRATQDTDGAWQQWKVWPVHLWDSTGDVWQ